MNDEYDFVIFEANAPCSKMFFESVAPIYFMNYRCMDIPLEPLIENVKEYRTQDFRIRVYDLNELIELELISKDYPQINKLI